MSSDDSKSKNKKGLRDAQERSILNPSSLSNCLNHIKLDWKKNKAISALWHDWPRIAGAKLASNCTPLTYQGGVLTIGASHPQWIQAVMFNRNQLLAALNAEGHEIKELRIKQHYPAKTNKKEGEQKVWDQHPSRYDIHGKENCPTCKTPSPAGEIALWKKCSFCRREELSNYII